MSESARVHDQAPEGHGAPVAESRTVMLGTEEPLELDCGARLENFPVAYEAYGELNAERSNLILLSHALSGDQWVPGSIPGGRTNKDKGLAEIG